MKTSFRLLVAVVGLLTYTLSAAYGQSGTSAHVGISLRYNTDMARYEVYAEANFTQQRFLLGPSQITLVLPKQVADASLNIVSATAYWTDYSTVYAPKAAPTVDFHGINSSGNLIDLTQDIPTLLFAFSLREGYVDGVRLFENGKDPNSDQPGMMGGDFSNTLRNHKNAEFYRGAFAEQLLAEGSPENIGTPALTVYPNPVTGGECILTVDQPQAGEQAVVRLVSSSGVELYRQTTTTEQLVKQRLQLPRQLSGLAHVIVERWASTSEKQVLSKKIIILN